MRRDTPASDPEPPTLSTGWHLFSLFVCYLIGVVFVAFIGRVDRGPAAIYSLFIAPVCGLPFLVLAFAGVILFKTRIERNPVPFLAALPFAAVFFWFIIEVFFLGGHFDEVFLLGLRGFLRHSLLQRLGFAFFVSAFSGLLYYRHLRDTMERARNKCEALRKMEGL